MYEADAMTTQMAMSQGRFADSGVYAEFHYHPKRNDLKSKELGRDIFEDTPYVRIMVPGDKDNIVFRPVRDTDKQRFPKQWQAFLAKEEQVQEGTPLSEWNGISRSQAEELKAFGIKTVEALVSMPDSHGQGFMGINALKAKAKAYIEDASFAAPIARLTQENEALRVEIEMLKAAMSEEPEEPPKQTRRRKAS